jgi:general secretion pathway protein K
MRRAREGERAARGGSQRERGFVLLIVLSALGLLAVVAAVFAHVTRTHVKSVSASVVAARAEALADAGANLAILDLVTARDREGSRRFALNAAPVSCTVEGEEGTVTIAVQDEAGKVDINIGSEAIVRALVLGLGLKGREAAADAILDYRDADDDRRLSGAELAEYRAAGRPYGPKNAAIMAVEELAGVLGLTQEDVDRLKPFVTVHSGQPTIDPSAAAPGLIGVLSRGVEEAGIPRKGPLESEMSFTANAPLPAELVGVSVRRAFSVRAEARLPGGATFVREAVVTLSESRTSPYAVRRWTRGSLAKAGSTPGPAVLSPC